MPANAAPILYVDDERFDAHAAPRPHPECPERLIAAREGLFHTLAPDTLLRIDARPTLDSQIIETHGPRHLARLTEAFGSERGFLDEDTFFSKGTRDAAWCAAGGAIALTEALMSGVYQRGFALLRPPGHHAERERAMGFCMINNIALAADAARRRGAQRIAIVDWDVHHGNGTEDIFRSDPDVLFISLHQWPLYPGTGALHDRGRGKGLGATLNIPLPALSNHETYLASFARLVLPALRRHRPDIILVSAGFDAHHRDPLAQMNLESMSYAAMTSALVALAEELGHGRVALFLEGGYDLRALKECVAASARALQSPLSTSTEGTCPTDISTLLDTIATLHQL